jgi:hypothetical protein
LENSFDYFYTGLYKLSFSDVNQSDYNFIFICLFMLFSTFSTFSIDSSMADCSAIIYFYRLVLNIAAFSIIYITCSLSADVATIFFYGCS